MKRRVACTDYQYAVQCYKFKNDFRLLELKGYDVVLTSDWMLTHSPVTWDYKIGTLKIKYYGLKNISFAPKAKSLECKVIYA
jgi:hypothetical protein